MILDIIVHQKRAEVALAKEQHGPLSKLERICWDLDPTRGFKEAFLGKKEISLIAEIKKASPSKGIIRPDFQPEEIAQIYTFNGAAAISVLTEEKFFSGHPEFLARVKEVSPLPLLRKDFIIDPFQIYEARLLGADAILLIAALLKEEELRSFQAMAASLGLDCLVEVHTQEELTVALDSGSEIIGINNRNLQTFDTDLNTTHKLREQIPSGHLVISESGINTRADVLGLEGAGVHGMLVGEALMRAADIGEKVRVLLGKE